MLQWDDSILAMFGANKSECVARVQTNFSVIFNVNGLV